jgi:hypothetical protein
MSDNLTALFLGAEDTWDNVQFTMWNVHGVWHSHSVSITGHGTALIGMVDASGQRQRRYDLTLDRTKARELIGLAVTYDLLATKLPTRTDLQPGEAMTTLVLSRDRRTFSLNVWANDPPPDSITAIVNALLALEQYTHGLTPAYEGPVETE